MAFRFVARRAAIARPAAPAVAPRRAFHASTPSFVKAGDEIPDLPVLVENSPANKINLADEFKSANGIVIGVPAAFSGACSSKHIPSYINHPKLSEAGSVFVVSVNDPFVMKAWGEQLDPAKQTGIRFLGDPEATFTKMLELDFDGTAIFGGVRGKRYALVIEDGKVKSAHVEPDNTGTNASMAEKVLG